MEQLSKAEFWNMLERVFVYDKPYMEDYSDEIGKNLVGDVRFREMFVKSGICRLNCVVFCEIGGDVDVWRVRIEHF
jgi:hypothetical protein